MTRMNERNSNRPDETRTGIDLVRDNPNLLPCSVQLGLDLATEDILHHVPSSYWTFRRMSEEKTDIQLHTEEVLRAILDAVLDL